jgi:cell division protein ZapA
VSAEEKFLDVNILGREYRVACPPGEREALEAAVGFVDERMNDIAAKSKTATPERVAVMAALNIAHELLEARARDNAPQIGPDGFDMTEAKRRMASMRIALDQALAPQEKLL